MDQNTFNTVVAVAAIVIALSFVIQALVFLRINSSLKTLIRIAQELQAKVEPVLTQAHATVSAVKNTVEKVGAQARESFDKIAIETRAVSAAIAVSSREIVEMARHQAVQFSNTLDQSNSMLERQVNDLDRLLTRTQVRVEDTTLEFQTTLVRPLRELSALIAGIRKMIDTLFNRGRKEIDHAYQDEEMFI